MATNRRPWPVAAAVAGWLAAAVATAQPAAVKPADAAAAPASAPVTVDIRAFGDTAYIGGNGVHADAPAEWVKRQLAGLSGLRSPDVNFLNLEAALTRECRQYADKQFMFSVAPGTLGQFLRWGFNLVSLANNHSLDCLDPSPVREAGFALRQAVAGAPGIAAHGLASGPALQLQKPALLTVKGVRLGMVAIKAWANGARAGIGNLSNRARLLEALRQSPVDVRILSLHGGLEATRRPTHEMMDLAREFILKYAGDLVLAHHSHLGQGVELLRRADGRYGAVFYSLGNFLHNGLSRNGDGVAAAVRVGAAGVDPDSLAVFPLRNTSWRPMPVSAAARTGLAAAYRDSSVAIALYPLPTDLKRVELEMIPVDSPAPGWRIKPKK